MQYICHSGGCPGADMVWENEGLNFGVKTIAYSFRNHIHEGKNPKILTVGELGEGWNAVLLANKTLQKNVNEIVYPYVKNLLCRNWFQVKNSEAIFAVGQLMSDRLVDGGTGWAVQMAIDNHKPVYIFNQKETGWFEYIYDAGYFMIMSDIPTLTVNFAGIGTRKITPAGIQSIKDIYRHNFIGK